MTVREFSVGHGRRVVHERASSGSIEEGVTAGDVWIALWEKNVRYLVLAQHKSSLECCKCTKNLIWQTDDYGFRSRSIARDGLHAVPCRCRNVNSAE